MNKYLAFEAYDNLIKDLNNVFGDVFEKSQIYENLPNAIERLEKYMGDKNAIPEIFTSVHDPVFKMGVFRDYVESVLKESKKIIDLLEYASRLYNSALDSLPESVEWKEASCGDASPAA